MATNKFFKHNIRSEQDLLENLTIEAIRIHGHDVVYLPRTLINRDFLFGEDSVSKFKKGYPIEMYLTDVDGFGGDGEFASKFGIQVKDTAGFIVAKKPFARATSGSTDPAITVPRAGDLIYFPLTNGLFEIKFVEDKNPFYEMGKIYSFKLSCELFEYSQEDFETGFTDIDSVVAESEDIAFNIYVTGGSTADYSIGEYVYQGATGFGVVGSSASWYGTVVGWATGGTVGPLGSGYKVLTVSGPSGATGLILGTGSNAGITGVTSGVFYKAGSTGAPSTTIVVSPDSYDDAGDLEISGDAIIDFSDTDPFSEGVGY